MKSKNKQPLSSYERAQKRVKDIKGFYGHLAAYIIVNLLILFTKGKSIFILINRTALRDVDYLNWIDWNTFGTAIVWGFFIGVHAISVFGTNPFLGKKWEERQLRKYMADDRNEVKEYKL